MSKLPAANRRRSFRRQAGSLRSLTVTMAVMCYLACLAIGALILINRAVDNWTSGLSREITVQVRELQQADIEVELAKAAEILKGFPGVVSVEILDREAGAKLLGTVARHAQSWRSAHSASHPRGDRRTEPAGFRSAGTAARRRR